MSNVIQLSDLNTTVNHEPRIIDVKLAEALGMSRPTNIRQKIESNIEELKMHGGVCTKAVQTTKSGGRPAIEYYLNEAQAILLCMFSRTEKAAAARKAIIEVFMAWRKGQLPVAPKPIQQKLPIQHKPIDAKAIHDSCDELFTILGHFKMLTAHANK
jgi:prophage antirepressor-like protein